MPSKKNKEKPFIEPKDSQFSQRQFEEAQTRIPGSAEGKEKAPRQMNASFYGAVGNDFVAANGYSWDLVIVMATEKPEGANYDYEQMITMLTRAGLETLAYYSVQKDEVYIKVRASLERLMDQADAANFKMKLDPGKLGAVASKGLPSHGIAPTT